MPVGWPGHLLVLQHPDSSSVHRARQNQGVFCARRELLPSHTERWAQQMTAHTALSLAVSCCCLPCWRCCLKLGWGVKFPEDEERLGYLHILEAPLDFPPAIAAWTGLSSQHFGQSFGLPKEPKGGAPALIHTRGAQSAAGGCWAILWGRICAQGSAVLRAFLPDALRSFSFSPMWMRLRFLSCSAVLGMHPAGGWGPMSSSRGMQAVPDSHPGVPPLCSPLLFFSFHAGNGVCAWRAQNSAPQWRCMNHGVPLHGKGTLCTHLSSPAASGRSL